MNSLCWNKANTRRPCECCFIYPRPERDDVKHKHSLHSILIIIRSEFEKSVLYDMIPLF